MMREASGSVFQEWKQEQQFPAYFSVKSPVIEKHLRVDPPYHGRFYAEQVTFDEILISHARLQINEPTSFQSQMHGDAISMLFFLKGDRLVCPTSEKGKQNFTNGHHNVYYAPGLACEFVLTAKDGTLEFVEVNLSKNYYFRLFNRVSADQHPFTAQIKNGETCLMHDTHLQITPAMSWIIHEMKHCQRTGCLKRLFLEAKVLELLMLQVEQAQQQIKPKKRNEHDYDLLMEAKQILEQHMVAPPTISKLSKMVGLNEFLLKKGFKDTFGTTIYGYVNQLKMQHARQLLLDQGESVSETAYRVGYKNPQHFTAAFKRYYGILPSELKK